MKQTVKINVVCFFSQKVKLLVSEYIQKFLKGTEWIELTILKRSQRKCQTIIIFQFRECKRVTTESKRFSNEFKAFLFECLVVGNIFFLELKNTICDKFFLLFLTSLMICFYTTLIFKKLFNKRILPNEQTACPRLWIPATRILLSSLLQHCNNNTSERVSQCLSDLELYKDNVFFSK